MSEALKNNEGTEVELSHEELEGVSGGFYRVTNDPGSDSSSTPTTTTTTTTTPAPTHVVAAPVNPQLAAVAASLKSAVASATKKL